MVITQVPETPNPAPDGGQAVSLDELLADARSGLDRVGPAQADAAVRSGAILVDIRPEAQRRDEGEIPGAVIIERNVLEWRVAPSSDHRRPEFDDPDRQVIVFCSAGYASSFAAATLRSLGVDATDLDGGFQAWLAAGLPTSHQP